MEGVAQRGGKSIPGKRNTMGKDSSMERPVITG